MKCPSCNSNNTKKKQIVWASGTRTGQKRSTGVGISTRGTIGLGVGKGRSFSQSHLAAICSPPQKSKIPIIVTGILFILFWIPTLKFVISSFNTGHLMSAVIGLPILLLISFSLYKLFIFLGEKNKEEIKAYSRTWVCLKCGNTYE
ncbi:hypothetical protein [Acinetobacter sp. 1125_18A]|uniref:hypothetical protein n=1 Tax=Acinetobacter sp. 1125_18A TaxID=2605959 RepID=UPI00405A1BC7